MKFSCPHCKTVYSIPDDKVRNKILKIRCRKCSNPILVTEKSVKKALQRRRSLVSVASPTDEKRPLATTPQQPPAIPTSALQPAATPKKEHDIEPKGVSDPPKIPTLAPMFKQLLADRPTDQWFAAIDDEIVGPVTLRTLHNKLASAPATTRIWHPRFGMTWRDASSLDLAASEHLTLVQSDNRQPSEPKRKLRRRFTGSHVTNTRLKKIAQLKGSALDRRLAQISNHTQPFPGSSHASVAAAAQPKIESSALPFEELVADFRSKPEPIAPPVLKLSPVVDEPASRLPKLKTVALVVLGILIGIVSVFTILEQRTPNKTTLRKQPTVETVPTHPTPAIDEPTRLPTPTPAPVLVVPAPAKPTIDKIAHKLHRPKKVKKSKINLKIKTGSARPLTTRSVKPIKAPKSVQPMPSKLPSVEVGDSDLRKVRRELVVTAPVTREPKFETDQSLKIHKSRLVRRLHICMSRASKEGLHGKFTLSFNITPTGRVTGLVLPARISAGAARACLTTRTKAFRFPSRSTLSRQRLLLISTL